MCALSYAVVKLNVGFFAYMGLFDYNKKHIALIVENVTQKQQEM